PRGGPVDLVEIVNAKLSAHALRLPDGDHRLGDPGETVTKQRIPAANVGSDVRIVGNRSGAAPPPIGSNRPVKLYKIVGEQPVQLTSWLLVRRISPGTLARGPAPAFSY
ncbi:MAG TPA: hypothetical protein VIJ07_00810, partial [Dermatophilaceae bacterium]